MNAEIEAVLRDCTEGSDEERLTFPEVVGKLMTAGVERYDADLQRGEKTYYLPDGGSLVVASDAYGGQPARDFSTAGVEASVRAIQAQTIKYREFCVRIADAGCVGYLVSLVGRRAVYYGRSGESYVEPFPTAK